MQGYFARLRPQHCVYGFRDDSAKMTGSRMVLLSRTCVPTAVARRAAFKTVREGGLTFQQGRRPRSIAL